MDVRLDDTIPYGTRRDERDETVRKKKQKEKEKQTSNRARTQRDMICAITLALTLTIDIDIDIDMSTHHGTSWKSRRTWTYWK